jgi:hypothetical protein
LSDRYFGYEFTSIFESVLYDKKMKDANWTDISR